MRKEPRRNPKLLGSVINHLNKTLMKKIQITTVTTNAEVQMIAPNAYFTVKAVKALYALKKIANDIKEQEKYLKDLNRNDIKCIEFPIEGLKEDLQPSLDFLDELLTAMEGE